MVDKIRKLMRPLIVATMLFLAACCVAKGEITGKDILILLGTISGFYFGERSALKKPGENDPGQ